MLSYDIHAFGRMIQDSVRTDAYAQALRRLVRPGSVVLDMGAGVGIWALLACRFGARKVYAVDPNDVIQIAREIAAANGYADKIEFINDMSTAVTLPEQADVLVTEMHGVVPMFEQNLPSIIDARQRLLAPGGRIIPQKEMLWVAPVEAPRSYEQVERPWADRTYDFDWAPARRIALNDWIKVKEKITPEQFLAHPQSWATLDYATLSGPNVAGEVTWKAARDGTCHGLIVWFETMLMEGVSFSNAPGLPDTIFGQAFFPCSQPVSIATGDTISVALRCDLVGTYHLWRWQTTVRNQANIKADFKQSTFFGMPISRSSLQKRAPHYAPKLSQDGEIQQFVLSLMDGKTSLAGIADKATGHFSSRFKSREEAERFVADLSDKYA